MNKCPEIINKVYDYVIPLRYLVPWLRYPMRNKILDNEPFFIIGSGRSGTTLLRRILIQVEGVHIPPETYVLGGVIKIYRQHAGMRWFSLVDLILSTYEYHPEFYTFNLGSLRELASRLKNLPSEQRCLVSIIDNIYRFHAEKNEIKCKVWGDKTPLNTLNIKRIDSVFENSKYIHLIRNPYDVIYSYTKNELQADVSSAARRWNEANKKALEFSKNNKERVLKVRYEELVSQPKDVVKKIFNFLNLDYNDKYLDSENHKIVTMGDVEKKKHHYNLGKKITRGSIGKGLKNLSKEELILIEPLIFNIKNKLGY
ncbi:sulfotransferase [Psychroflexus sp. CAK1W]|uniref:sulfotransferase family protein n=1 Tax=Psychroflexus curvus TaxID=2873595 RepID=UPI001CCB0B3B|nr:sulfotransferase [Psychroflexus curvus]MBZ9629076.1 sulfotransferase [Psychroflexus curvus]